MGTFHCHCGICGDYTDGFGRYCSSVTLLCGGRLPGLSGIPVLSFFNVCDWDYVHTVSRHSVFPELLSFQFHEKDKTDIKAQLTTAEEDILKRKELQQSADENINNLKSQVKSLKTKSTLNKILVPVALGVGVFTGYQIAK